MAKDKEDIDLDLEDDDFDWGDDDFNIEDNFGDGSENKADRTPVENLKVGLKEGFKSTLDIGVIEAASDKILPKEFTNVKDDLKSYVTEGKQLLDESLGEVNRSVSTLRGQLGKAAKIYERTNALPKFLTDFMKKLAGKEQEREETYREASQEEKDRAEIVGALDDLTKAQIELQKNSEAREMLRDRVDGKRFESQQELLFGIRTSLQRSTDYNEQIASRYYNNQIKISYQQLHAQRAIYKTVLQSAEHQKQALDSIVKNTALPDIVKSHNREIFKDVALRRTGDFISNRLSDFMGGYKEQLMKNINDQVKGFTDTFKSTMEMAGMGLETAAEGHEMMYDMGERQSVGEKGGKYIANLIRNRVLKAAVNRLNKNSFVSAKAEQLSGIMTNSNVYANRLADKLTNSDSMIANFIGNLLPKYREKTIETNLHSRDKLKEIAEFDNQTRTSIVDIIPGLLSKIHQSTEAIRMKVSPGELSEDNQLEWDHNKNTFTSRRELKDELVKEISKKARLEEQFNLAYQMISAIDEDKILKEGFVRLVATEIVTTSGVSKGFEPNEWLNKLNGVIKFKTQRLNDPKLYIQDKDAFARLIREKLTDTSRMSNDQLAARARKINFLNSSQTQLDTIRADGNSRVGHIMSTSGTYAKLLDEAGYVSTSVDGVVSYDSKKAYNDEKIFSNINDSVKRGTLKRHKDQSTRDFSKDSSLYYSGTIDEFKRVKGWRPSEDGNGYGTVPNKFKQKINPLTGQKQERLSYDHWRKVIETEEGRRLYLIEEGFDGLSTLYNIGSRIIGEENIGKAANQIDKVGGFFTNGVSKLGNIFGITKVTTTVAEKFSNATGLLFNYVNHSILTQTYKIPLNDPLLDNKYMKYGDTTKITYEDINWEKLLRSDVRNPPFYSTVQSFFKEQLKYGSTEEEAKKRTFEYICAYVNKDDKLLKEIEQGITHFNETKDTVMGGLKQFGATAGNTFSKVWNVSKRYVTDEDYRDQVGEEVTAKIKKTFTKLKNVSVNDIKIHTKTVLKDFQQSAGDKWGQHAAPFIGSMITHVKHELDGTKLGGFVDTAVSEFKKIKNADDKLEALTELASNTIDVNLPPKVQQALNNEIVKARAEKIKQLSANATETLTDGYNQGKDLVTRAMNVPKGTLSAGVDKIVTTASNATETLTGKLSPVTERTQKLIDNKDLKKHADKMSKILGVKVPAGLLKGKPREEISKFYQAVAKGDLTISDIALEAVTTTKKITKDSRAQQLIDNTEKLLDQGKSYANTLVNKIARKEQPYYDIYIKGENHPRLTASDLKAGKYYIRTNNGDSKEIVRYVEDITDAVYFDNPETGAPECIITLEEVRDKKVVSTVGGEPETNPDSLASKLSSASRMDSWTATKKLVKLMAKPVTHTMYATDAYLPGDEEGEPLRLVISKWKLLAGMYKNAEGKRIYSIKDIKGGVFSLSGDTVVAEEDLKRLVDKNGRPLAKSYFIRRARLAKDWLTTLSKPVRAAAGYTTRKMLTEPLGNRLGNPIQKMKGFFSGLLPEGFGFRRNGVRTKDGVVVDERTGNKRKGAAGDLEVTQDKNTEERMRAAKERSDAEFARRNAKSKEDHPVVSFLKKWGMKLLMIGGPLYTLFKDGFMVGLGKLWDGIKTGGEWLYKNFSGTLRDIATYLGSLIVAKQGLSMAADFMGRGALKLLGKGAKGVWKGGKWAAGKLFGKTASTTATTAAKQTTKQVTKTAATKGATSVAKYQAAKAGTSKLGQGAIGKTVAKAAATSAAKTTAVKTTAKIATNAIAKTAVKAGAKVAGRAALAFLGPVGAALMLAWTVYDIGSFIWDYFKSDPNKIDDFRMAAYGINPKHERRRNVIFKLEELFSKNTKIDKKTGVVTLPEYEIGKDKEFTNVCMQLLTDSEKEKGTGLLETLSEEERAPYFGRLDNWLTNRFIPVFYQHTVALATIDPSKKLRVHESFDRVGTNTIKFGLVPSWLKRVRFENTADSPYFVLDDPFAEPLDDVKDDILVMSPSDVEHYYNIAMDAYKNDEKDLRKSDKNSQERWGYFNMKGDDHFAFERDEKLNQNKSLNKEQLTNSLSGGNRPAHERAQMQKVYNKDGSITKTTIIGGNTYLLEEVEKVNLDGRDTIDDGTAIRMRLYGLIELTTTRVTNLLSLEKYMIKYLKLSTNNHTSFDEFDFNHVFNLYGPSFGWFKSNPDDVANFSNWFKLRFSPIYLAFASLVNKYTSGSNIFEDIKNIKPENKHALYLELTRVQSIIDGRPVSIWELPFSPFKNYVANKDGGTIAANIKSLEEGIESTIITEKDPSNKIVDESNLTINNSKESGVGYQSVTNLINTVGNAAGLATAATASITGNPAFNQQSSLTNIAGTTTGSNYQMTDIEGTGNISGITWKDPGTWTNGNGQGSHYVHYKKNFEIIKPLLAQVSKVVGIDPTLLTQVARVESGFHPKSGNGGPTDGFKGLYAIGGAAYHDYYRRLNNKYKLNLPPPTGEKINPQVLETLHNPVINALMGAEMLKDAKKKMEPEVRGSGFTLEPAFFYLQHFLGPSGASKFIRALKTNPNAPASVGMSQAAIDNNKSIAFGEGGMRTLSGVLGELRRRLNADGGIEMGREVAALAGVPVSSIPTEPTINPTTTVEKNTTGNLSGVAGVDKGSQADVLIHAKNKLNEQLGNVSTPPVNSGSVSMDTVIPTPSTPVSNISNSSEYSQPTTTVSNAIETGVSTITADNDFIKSDRGNEKVNSVSDILAKPINSSATPTQTSSSANTSTPAKKYSMGAPLKAEYAMKDGVQKETILGGGSENVKGVLTGQATEMAIRAATEMEKLCKSNGFGKASCAKTLRMALHNAGYKGFNIGDQPGSAYMYHTTGYLRNKGFTLIADNSNIGSYKPILGDIVVNDRRIGPYKDSLSIHGHIAMYTRLGWTSYWKQNTIYPNSAAGHWSRKAGIWVYRDTNSTPVPYNLPANTSSGKDVKDSIADVDLENSSSGGKVTGKLAELIAKATPELIELGKQFVPSSKDTRTMNPTFMKLLYASVGEHVKYKNPRFGKLPIYSTGRTYDHQKRLYEENLRNNGGKPSDTVAKPGNSRHNYGLALDITAGSKGPEKGVNADFNTGPLAEWEKETGKLWGFVRPLRTGAAAENWHVENVLLQPKGKFGNLPMRTLSGFSPRVIDAPLVRDGMTSMPDVDAVEELADTPNANSGNPLETAANNGTYNNQTIGMSGDSGSGTGDGSQSSTFIPKEIGGEGSGVWDVSGLSKEDKWKRAQENIAKWKEARGAQSMAPTDLIDVQKQKEVETSKINTSIDFNKSDKGINVANSISAKPINIGVTGTTNTTKDPFNPLESSATNGTYNNQTIGSNKVTETNGPTSVLGGFNQPIKPKEEGNIGKTIKQEKSVLSTVLDKQGIQLENQQKQLREQNQQLADRQTDLLKEQLAVQREQRDTLNKLFEFFKEGGKIGNTNVSNPNKPAPSFYPIPNGYQNQSRHHIPGSKPPLINLSVGG